MLCHVTQYTAPNQIKTQPIQTADQLADQANHSQRISSSAINGSQPSTAPVYHAHVHTVAKSRSLSLLSPAILPFSSDLPFSTVWSLWTTTERLSASYKAKPRPFAAFSQDWLDPQVDRTIRMGCVLIWYGAVYRELGTPGDVAQQDRRADCFNGWDGFEF